jgi:hypothetical protein
LAEIVGVDKNTVQSVREQLIAGGEIHQVKVRDGRDGKSYRQPASMIVHSPAAARKAQGLLSELGDDAPAGRSLSPREAATLVNIKRRERADTRVEEGLLPREVRIIQSAFQEVGHRIKDESIDLIYTDPPYGQEFLDQWDDLGAFASRVLRPGALMVAYTGQSHLGEVIAALSEHLSYVWCMAIAHSQRQCRIHHKKVVNAWKPLLVFGKGTSRFPDTIWDLFQGNGADKDHHDWAQGLDEAIHFIQALVPAGSHVCDPCLGSGTTGVAAIRCGMRFVGCEVEEGTFVSAKSRLAREAREGRS